MNISKKNFIIIIILLSILLITFARYNGNYHSDVKDVWLYLNGDLTQDIYEKNSLYIGTSIFFNFFKFFNISLDNDIFGIVLHYILTIFGGVYFYKVLKKFFPETENIDIIFIVVTLSILDNFILDTTRSSWIYHHTMTATQAAMSFFFYFMYQIINNNRLNLFFSAPIFLLLSIKLSWFPLGCFLIYCFYENKKFSDIYWILSCLIVVVFLSVKFQNISYDSNIKSILFEQVINREAEETVIHLQSKLKIFLNIICFFVYYKLLKFISNHKFYNLSFVILITSILLFIFGGLYGMYGQNFYPEPKILILSAVRAMFLFQLFFGILFCNFIIKKVLKNNLKYTLLTLPFLISFGLKGIILSILLVFSVFILTIIDKKNLLKLNEYIFIIVIFILSLNSALNRYAKIDRYTFSEIKHWSTLMPGQYNFKNFFINVRACPDFMIFNDFPKTPTKANFFANKSKYYKSNSGNIALNYELFKEHKRRSKIIDQLQNYDNNYSNELRNTLINENFVYVSEKKINLNITNIKKSFGYIYFFFNDSELINLKKNCQLLFN